MMQSKFYSTKEVLKKVGISRNTLFLWFKHRKIPEVQRDRNGYRIFTERDIQGIMDYKNKIIPSHEAVSAFTIVELMIASSILVCVLGAFLLSFNNTLKSTNYSQGFALARRACQTKLEEMINHDFGSIITDYSPGGNPGNTFDFNTSELIGKGSITIIPREDLYGGGEHNATLAAPWSPREHHSCLAYDGKIWIMGGGTSSFLNDVWYSTNGTNWNNATLAADWSPRMGHACVVYDNKMWLMGGTNGTVYLNDVWYSADGANWISAPPIGSIWSVRSGHTAVVYKNAIWVMGGTNGTGYINDVWNSTDGRNWVRATAGAGWAVRANHTSLVYNNAMWVIGGQAAGYLNDVWNSTDGVTWVRVTNAAGWTARAAHTSLVFGRKMWVMGGVGSGGNRNDVWFSSNGTKWTSATTAANWAARKGHASTVYDSKMWVIGGYNGSYPVDAWYSAGYNRVLEVFTTAAWRHYDGRTFGEDRNLTGTLDAGEDLNNNSRLDSPVELRAILSDKDVTGVFLGKNPQ